MAQVKGIISCPRWTNFAGALKDYCWSQDIELETDIDKRLLTETIRYKATADVDKLNRLQERIAYIVEVNDGEVS